MVIDRRHLIKTVVFVIFVVICIQTTSGEERRKPRQTQVYSNREFGISFNLPRELDIYTPDKPGPLASMFTERQIVYLVNPNFRDENIGVKYSTGITESDLKQFKNLLDTNPPMSSLPGYKKISVKFIKIGIKRDKLAVEHIYNMKGNVSGTLRQVIFVHNELGFTFTCGTSKNRFEKTNKEIFEFVFKTMSFQTNGDQVSLSSESKLQPLTSNTQIDVQKEITRLYSDDPVEKEDAAFKISCQPEKARSAIPHLIKLLDDKTPTTVRTQVPFSSMKDQYMTVQGTVSLAADSALRRITGKTGGCADWHRWWKEHEKELEISKVDVDRIRASHILISTAKLDAEGKAKAKEKIESLLKQIRAGASFEELAKAHSDCPSRINGGDLGYFKRGKMVKEFEDVAFALKIGEVSDVVETPYGYHIIKLTGQKSLTANVPDTKAEQELLTACQENNIGKVKKLLSEGVNPNAQDPQSGATALMLASEKGNKDIVELLLDRKALINLKSINGRTALYGAVMSGNIEVAKVLVAKGADINAEDLEGGTPLHAAVTSDDINSVEFLLAQGANIEAKAGAGGFTPLFFAAGLGLEKITKVLIDSGASVDVTDSEGNTPLLAAVANHHKDVASLLVSAGADVNIKGKQGSALWIAASGNNKEIVKLLIENGANLNTPPGIPSPLHAAVTKGHKDLTELLINKGAIINTTDHNGFTPLHIAAFQGNKEIVNLLIARGANINIVGNKGETVSQMALANKHHDIVAMLRKKAGMYSYKVEANNEIKDNENSVGTTQKDISNECKEISLTVIETATYSINRIIPEQRVYFSKDWINREYAYAGLIANKQIIFPEVAQSTSTKDGKVIKYYAGVPCRVVQFKQDTISIPEETIIEINSDNVLRNGEYRTIPESALQIEPGSGIAYSRHNRTHGQSTIRIGPVPGKEGLVIGGERCEVDSYKCEEPVYISSYNPNLWISPTSLIPFECDKEGLPKRAIPTAIGITWKFPKKDQRIQIGKIILAATEDGGTVQFTENGPILTGVEKSDTNNVPSQSGKSALPHSLPMRKGSTEIHAEKEDAQEYIDRGDKLLNQGKLEAAISEYTKAININPNKVVSFMHRGVAYARLKQYEKAINDLTWLIKGGVADVPMVGLGPDVYYSRGSIYVDMQQYEKALADFSSGIGVASRLYNKAKQRSAAIDFSPWLKQSLLQCYHARATVYSLIKEYSKALKDYDEALRLFPDEPTLYGDRADIYQKMGKIQEEEEDRQKYEKLMEKLRNKK